MPSRVIAGGHTSAAVDSNIKSNFGCRLQSIDDFFKYVDSQDADFFNSIDTDGDGKVTAEDLKAVLAQSNLPAEYANQFIKRARAGRLWGGAITCASSYHLGMPLAAGSCLAVKAMDLAMGVISLSCVLAVCSCALAVLT